jgi:hypothetical protein
MRKHQALLLTWGFSGHIQFPLLELSIINFEHINIKIWILSANCIEPGQTARIYRLAWLYTGGKGWSLGSSIVRVKPFLDVDKLTTRPLIPCFCVINDKALLCLLYIG